jgi:putative FmdB family regulatory protein
MPLYEYQCEACSHRFERIHKFSDPPIATCPTCGGSVRKLFSSPAIKFKGSGFYINDYAKKSSTDSKASDSNDSSKESSSKESSSKESKEKSDRTSADTSNKGDSSTKSSETSTPAKTTPTKND